MRGDKAMNEEEERNFEYKEIEETYQKAYREAGLPPRTWYKLENRKVVECSVFESVKQLADLKQRTVGCDQIGPYVISTVFLCIDHSYTPGHPLWFETMIFSIKTGEGIFFDHQNRYETYEEALAGHQTAVKLVEEGIWP